ncbi:Hypothetical predicted protein [Lecanosticta acicola]|uniref:Uncharacterized protein n=1 Tax=Lecanosticta acicola TaxID=111012 RepID=A0AAI8Z2K5_9PEZI|nr:Hypothetical predicted protein [Lecanosticta acicola]
MLNATSPQYDYFAMYENYRDRQHSISQLSSATTTPPELPMTEEFPTPNGFDPGLPFDFEEDPGTSQDEESAAPPSPRNCGHETIDPDCASCLVRWHLAADWDDFDGIHSSDEHAHLALTRQRAHVQGEIRSHRAYFGPRGSLDLHTITCPRVGERDRHNLKPSNWIKRKLGRMGVLRLVRRVKWAVRMFVEEWRELEEIGEGEQGMDLSYRV